MPRKALRAYPVASRAGAERLTVPRAVRAARPDDILAPRAVVVRREAPADAWTHQVAHVERAAVPAPMEVWPAPPPRPVTKRPRMAVVPPHNRVPGANVAPTDGSVPPSAAALVGRCDAMALRGLVYKFGADDPSSGGFDCSGAVQYLLRATGIGGVPRTAFAQYQWLKDAGTLHKVSRWTWSAERVANQLRAGDLLFWTGTYDTGRSLNISHVMIYLGRDPSSGKHYMFGASSRRSKGIHGHAVDVYEFVYPREHGKDNFAGFGTVPGLGR